MADQRPAVSSITESDISDGKTMAILAYIIFLIPLFAARDKKFAMFHTEQAIALVILSVVIRIIVAILVALTETSIFGLLNIVILVFWIMGLVNAIGGKTKELPLIGAIGAKFNLVK